MILIQPVTSNEAARPLCAIKAGPGTIFANMHNILLMKTTLSKAPGIGQETRLREFIPKQKHRTKSMTKTPRVPPTIKQGEINSISARENICEAAGHENELLHSLTFE
jgi:hypothetical protein